VENAETRRTAPPSREANRSSFSLSADNYDMVWNESKRLNIAMTAAINVVLDEVRQWRNGLRRRPARKREGGGQTAKASPPVNGANQPKVRFTG
jgi:hypothetical protein